MNLKQLISTIFWYPISSKLEIEKYQQFIRQLEWDYISDFIPEKASFLDIGCGAGFSLSKAHKEKECEVIGIDPKPGEHGVGRFTKDILNGRPIIEGSAENLPFEENSFDVVYCSHVLEHVTSETLAIQEMKRVLKPNGIIIIGVPTSSMSIISLISSILFTTHISIYHFVYSIGKKDMFHRFLRIFIPKSHSFPRAKFIFYDLLHYRISNWRRIISESLKINNIITPGLYPYPDYIQWFPLIKKSKISSSVFFICKK